MNIKNILLVTLLACPAIAFSQDRIYKTDGDIINAKVLEIGPQTVTFKRTDNPDGPEYTLSKSEIKLVKYENGKIDKFSEADDNRGMTYSSSGRGIVRRRKKGIKYGSNMLYLTPLAPINDPVQDGFCFGLGYEHVFGEKGLIGLNISALADLYARVDQVTNANQNPSYSYLSFYAIPGLKYYPWGSKAKFRYAFGSSFYIGQGKENDQDFYYDKNGIIQEERVQKTVTTMGILLTNSLNFSPTKHLYFGIDIDTGMPFSDNRKDGGTGFENSIIMLAFKLGYRF